MLLSAKLWPPGVLLEWPQKKGADPWMPGAVPPGNTIPELELMLDQYALINSPNKVGLDLAAAWLLWQAGWQWQAAKSQLAIEIDSLKDQCNELEKERDMWMAQTLTASAQASSLSVAAVQAATAEEERQRVETENATLSQAVTCLKDLVLEGSAWENRVRGAYSAWVAAIGVKAQGDAGPYDDWDRDIWFDLDPLDPDPRWPNPRHHVAAVQRVVQNYGPAPAGRKAAPSTGHTVAETKLTLKQAIELAKTPEGKWVHHGQLKDQGLPRQEHCSNLFLSFYLSASKLEHQESWYQLTSYRNTMVIVLRQSLYCMFCVCLWWVSCASIGPRERGDTTLDRINAFSSLCFPHLQPNYHSHPPLSKRLWSPIHQVYFLLGSLIIILLLSFVIDTFVLLVTFSCIVNSTFQLWYSYKSYLLCVLKG
ncbi:uncharacterized protein LOC125642131 [Caretta caretta]|uniref:uncharacterized protein LOC125642131 n=1 Tax=Caretta caretta TaxID=8467 RepID=UPI003F4B3512